MFTDNISQTPPDSHQRVRFHTTRWSVVFAASGKSPGVEVSRALEALCKQYWMPLYTYVRVRGYSEHDAQDLTQEFFARLLEKGWLASADSERGRFRSFLLVAIKRFLANEWDRSQAKKRGGPVKFIHFDRAEQIPIPDSKGLSPELVFERDWALALLETTMSRLKSEYESAGRAELYRHLKPCLTAARGSLDYQNLASVLGMEPVSARSAVHRMRKRYRDLFREEVAGTVADPSEVDDEMRSVIAALANG